MPNSGLTFAIIVAGSVTVASLFSDWVIRMATAGKHRGRVIYSTAGLIIPFAALALYGFRDLFVLGGPAGLVNVGAFCCGTLGVLHLLATFIQSFKHYRDAEMRAVIARDMT